MISRPGFEESERVSGVLIGSKMLDRVSLSFGLTF